MTGIQEGMTAAQVSEVLMNNFSEVSDEADRAKTMAAAEEARAKGVEQGLTEAVEQNAEEIIALKGNSATKAELNAEAERAQSAEELISQQAEQNFKNFSDLGVEESAKIDGYEIALTKKTNTAGKTKVKVPVYDMQNPSATPVGLVDEVFVDEMKAEAKKMVDAEAERAEAKEQKLSGDLATEAERASNAEGTIMAKALDNAGRITALETASATKAELSAEAERASNAEKNIATLVQQNAGKIKVLEDVSATKGELAAEEERAKEAEQALRDSVDAEVQARIEAVADIGEKLTELESEFGVAKSGNEAVTIPLNSIKAGSKVAISIDGDDDIFPVGVFVVSEGGDTERIYYIYKDSELRYYAEYEKSNDNVLKLSVNASKNKLFSVSLATQSASIETMKTIAKLKQKGNDLTSSRSYGLFTNGALNSIIKEVVLKKQFDISTIKSVAVRRAYEVNSYFYNNIYLYADSTIVLYEKVYSTKEEALQDAELKYYEKDSAYVLADFSKVNEGENSFETKVNYPLTMDNSPILHSLFNSERLQDFKETLYQESVNLFNKDSQLIKKGYWGGSAQNGIFCEHNDYRVTHPIYLERGIRYKCIPFNLGNNPLVAQVNESNESIAFFNAVLSNEIILFTPTQSGYYSFNIGTSGRLNGFIVAKEDEYPSEYVPYVSRIKDGLVDKESTTFWKKEKSVNLFDKNNSLVASGYWQNSSLIEYATIYHTHPIFLEKDTEYKLPFAKGTLGSNDSVVQVDENNNPKSGLRLIIDGETATFTPTESGYYSFNIGEKIHIDTFMVTKASEYPSEYVPYYDFWSLPDLKLKSENLLPDIVTNVLYGKSVAFDGDSICEGAGFKGGYGKIIAERNNMIYQNRGIGGGTITAETYSSSTGAARHWICRDIQNLNQDADYVILEGGVNDASLNGKLGEVTDGYNAELDDTTFCGAFESMIKQCYQRFPSAKLGFIIVHRMTTNYNPGGSFYEKAVEILKKWAVPYIDLSLLVPPLNYIQSLKEVYTNAADGWHPNELGYKTFYCDKIEEWMKTL